VSEYDKHGNIKRLKRYALNTPAATSGTLVDDLTLIYTGNQIKSVTDAVSSSTSTIGFIPVTGAQNYVYNKNGALTSDYNRGISGIQYNCLDLPERIQFIYGHNTRYSYDATGIKRRVVSQSVKNNMNIPIGQTNCTPDASNVQATLTTDYCGNVVYENGALKYILTPEGYVTKNGRNTYYNYYLKDHLGNNRIVLEVIGSASNVIQATDYYPFGMPYANGVSPEKQPYKFGGKEYDEMHGLNWYDFEARHLDAIILRFSTMDPLCEKYPWMSPYAYCGNNPVNRIDPTGMEWRTESDVEYARKLAEEMAKKAKSEEKIVDTKFKEYRKALGKGDTEKAAKIETDMRKIGANISNMEAGISELNEMGATREQVFTYNNTSKNVGGSEIDDNGVIVMDIANDGSLSNGVH
jgi:RHS repeat-associated protein